MFKFLLSTDTYTGAEGTRTKKYDIPPLTERQKQANSVFERVSDNFFLLFFNLTCFSCFLLHSLVIFLPLLKS